MAEKGVTPCPVCHHLDCKERNKLRIFSLSTLFILCNLFGIMSTQRKETFSWLSGLKIPRETVMRVAIKSFFLFFALRLDCYVSTLKDLAHPS